MEQVFKIDEENPYVLQTLKNFHFCKVGAAFRGKDGNYFLSKNDIRVLFRRTKDESDLFELNIWSNQVDKTFEWYEISFIYETINTLVKKKVVETLLLNNL